MRKVSEIIFIGVLLCAFWASLNSQSKLAYLYEVQAKQKLQLEKLEVEQNRLKAEILARTDPEYVDMSLKQHFDDLLKK